jgi:predicted transcriptional regulator
MTAHDKMELLELTTEIVAAHVGSNQIPRDQLPQLIVGVHRALAGLGSEPTEKPIPVVPIKKSVQEDAVTCLECGWSGKMLKRHLSTAHDLSVDEYREKWSLSAAYPVVAPSYAARRSELAKKIGLGRKPRERGRKKG